MTGTPPEVVAVYRIRGTYHTLIHRHTLLVSYCHIIYFVSGFLFCVAAIVFLLNGKLMVIHRIYPRFITFITIIYWHIYRRDAGAHLGFSATFSVLKASWVDVFF